MHLVKQDRQSEQLSGRHSEGQPGSYICMQPPDISSLQERTLRESGSKQARPY